MREELLCGDGMHPCDVSVHRFPSNHLEQINGMNSPQGRTVIINVEHVVPIVFCEHVHNRGHGIRCQECIWVLHHVRTSHGTDGASVLRSLRGFLGFWTKGHGVFRGGRLPTILEPFRFHQPSFWNPENERAD